MLNNIFNVIRRQSSHKQKGETIVEVLISLAVLSAALGGVYAITNRSQISVQANHERYEAQLLANEQADQLKLALADSVNYAAVQGLTATDWFCLPNLDNTNCLRGTDSRYEVKVFPRPRTVGGVSTVDTFIIQVQWDSLVNDTKDQVELIYGI